MLELINISHIYHTNYLVSLTSLNINTNSPSTPFTTGNALFTSCRCSLFLLARAFPTAVERDVKAGGCIRCNSLISSAADLLDEVTSEVSI